MAQTCTHELVLLSQIRQHFDRLMPTMTHSLIEFLVTNGKQSTILSGIYRQLYHEGGRDENHIKFLQSLLSHINKLIQSQPQSQSQTPRNETSPHLRNDDYFNHLPNTLMCEIGSYLTSKEILTKWNIVNRKFLEIAYKPETHTKWDFSYDSDVYIKRNKPKFGLNTLVSKLKTMKYNSNFSSLFNLNDAKNAQNVAIGMFGICFSFIRFMFMLRD